MDETAIMLLGGIVFFTSVILLFLLIKREMEKKQNIDKTEKEQTIDVPKYITELIPITKYDTKINCYLKNNGTYMDFVKISTKDINSVSESEKTWDAMHFAKFYMTYADDIKIITLNYPCSTTIQQEYIKSKIENTKNQKFVQCLKQSLFELEWLEKNKTTREFYLFIFSKDLDNFYKDLERIKNVLMTGRDGLIEILPMEKKHQILYKIANKNSFIFK